MKDITSAIETILKAGTSGYIIERNAARNHDADAAKNGWIGIYKGRITYDGFIIGANPYAARPEIIVELQRANFNKGSDVEDDLETMVAEVLGILIANKTLNSTISMTLGYDVDYEINTSGEESVYIYSALITIRGEKPKNG